MKKDIFQLLLITAICTIIYHLFVLLNCGDMGNPTQYACIEDWTHPVILDLVVSMGVIIFTTIELVEY